MQQDFSSKPYLIAFFMILLILDNKYSREKVDIHLIQNRIGVITQTKRSSLSSSPSHESHNFSRETIILIVVKLLVQVYMMILRAHRIR